eukprot:4679121-Amphidinium_carterae.1
MLQNAAMFGILFHPHGVLCREPLLQWCALTKVKATRPVGPEEHEDMISQFSEQSTSAVGVVAAGALARV